MTTIWKYPLSVIDKQILTVPEGFYFLSVGLDCSGTPCIWFEVDSDNLLELITLYFVGTGNPLPEAVDYYLGSITMDPFVWHVYRGED